MVLIWTISHAPSVGGPSVRGLGINYNGKRQVQITTQKCKKCGSRRMTFKGTIARFVQRQKGPV